MTEDSPPKNEHSQKNRRKLRIGTAFVLAFAIVLVLQLRRRMEFERQEPGPMSRESKPRISVTPENMDVADRDGQLLAAIHCSRCHPVPKPSHLPREHWPFMMTYMGNYLGYAETNGPFSGIVNARLIPDQPILSREELIAIQEYYVRDSRPQNEMLVDPEPRSTMHQFQPYDRGPRNVHDNFISLVHFNDTTGLYYLGLGDQKKLRLYTRQGEELFEVSCSSEPIHVEVIEGGFRLGEIGDFDFDHAAGNVLEFTHGQGELSVSPIVTNFARLVESHGMDFDGDEIEDLLLVGFGQGENGRASIYWGRGTGGDAREESALINYSGALHAELYDYDEDGDNDIFILTAQRRQELWLFENEGGRNFLPHRVLTRFAGFGFNSFAMADFNGDGREDLLLVNGNNMELRVPPLRPYHGLRILLNRGGMNFKVAAFFPLYGAIKAIPHDFDLDGDLDIATIAFYPDWSASPPETFVYLENLGDLEFRPHALDNAPWGRWITMDSGDVDADGDQDLLLGAGHIQLGIAPHVRERYAALIKDAPSFLVLENKAR